MGHDNDPDGPEDHDSLPDDEREGGILRVVRVEAVIGFSAGGTRDTPHEDLTTAPGSGR